MPGPVPNQEIREVFAKFDVDGSGDVDASELRDALKELGLKLDGEQVDYMLRKYDNNRGATLDIEEFAQLVQDLRMNSADTLQERLDLRTHASVQRALTMWWMAAERSLDREAATRSKKGITGFGVFSKPTAGDSARRGSNLAPSAPARTSPAVLLRHHYITIMKKGVLRSEYALK